MSIAEVALSILLFFAGIAVTHYYYRRGHKKRELSWAYHSRPFGDIPRKYRNSVRLALGRKNLRSPSAHQVYIWNSGNETIGPADIPDGHELSVQLVNSVFCTGGVSRVTNAANGIFVASSTTDTWNIRFAYLDPGDGVLLEFMSEATDKTTGLKVTGAIKGQGIIRSQGEFLWFENPGSLASKAIHITSTLVFVPMAAIFSYNAFLNFDLRTTGTYADLIATIVFLVIAVALAWTLPGGLRKLALLRPPEAIVERA